MSQLCVFLLLAFSAPFLASSQENQFTLKTLDANTGEPVSFASVCLMVQHMQLYGTTDEQGQLSLPIMAKRSVDSVRVSHIGYERITVPTNGSKTLELKLNPAIHDLPETHIDAVETTPQQLLRKVLDDYKNSTYANLTYSYSYEDYFFANGDTLGHAVAYVNIAPREKALKSGRLVQPNNSEITQHTSHHHAKDIEGFRLFKNANSLKYLLKYLDLELLFDKPEKRRVIRSLDSMLINGEMRPVIQLVYFPKDKYIGTSICTIDMETHELIEIRAPAIAYHESNSFVSQSEWNILLVFNGHKMPERILSQHTSFQSDGFEYQQLNGNEKNELKQAAIPKNIKMTPVDFSKNMYSQGE